MSNLLIPSLLISEVSELLRSLTKNEQMSELLVVLSESLIHSFFRKKRAIRSENRWANSQPWKNLPLFLFLCLKLEAAPTKLQNFPLSGNSV